MEIDAGAGGDDGIGEGGSGCVAGIAEHHAGDGAGVGRAERSYLREIGRVAGDAGGCEIKLIGRPADAGARGDDGIQTGIGIEQRRAGRGGRADIRIGVALGDDGVVVGRGVAGSSDDIVAAGNSDLRPVAERNVAGVIYFHATVGGDFHVVENNVHHRFFRHGVENAGAGVAGGIRGSDVAEGDVFPDRRGGSDGLSVIAGRIARLGIAAADVVAGDVERVLHVGHGDVGVGDIFHQPAGSASGFEAKTIRRSVEGDVGDGHVVEAVVGFPAYGNAVPGADRAIGNGDVAAIGALRFDGDVVVAVGDIAIFDKNIRPGGVDPVGVWRGGRGGNRDAVNNDIGDRIEGHMLFRRILDRDAGNQKRAGILDVNQVGPGGRTIIPPARRAATAAAVAVDDARAGDLKIRQMIAGDEVGAGAVGRNPIGPGQSLKLRARVHLQIDVAGHGQGTGQPRLRRGGNLHNSAGEAIHFVGGGGVNRRLNRGRVVGRGVHRAVTGDIENGGRNVGRRGDAQQVSRLALLDGGGDE